MNDVVGNRALIFIASTGNASQNMAAKIVVQEIMPRICSIVVSIHTIDPLSFFSSTRSAYGGVEEVSPAVPLLSPRECCLKIIGVRRCDKS